MELISRADAIKDAESWTAVDEHERHLQKNVIEWLKEFPTAELSTNLAEVGTDCISRQAAIDALKGCYCGGEDSCGEQWIYEDHAIKAVEQLPPIRPKRGKWIHHPEIGWGETWLCDQCGEKTTSTVMGKPRANYCPMCGADMRGEQE